jgi:hypothetical protein
MSAFGGKADMTSLGFHALFLPKAGGSLCSRWKPVHEFAIETLIDVVASITNTLGKRKHAFSAISALPTVSTKSRSRSTHMNRYRRLVLARAITPAYVGIELGFRLRKGYRVVRRFF